jgi:hypothetical protein
MSMTGASTPASPGTPTTAPACKATRRLGPANVIHCRSRSHARGGIAIGAYIIRRRRAPDLMLCDCCTCIVAPGAVVVDAELAGELLVVCADCAGPA